MKKISNAFVGIFVLLSHLTMAQSENSFGTFLAAPVGQFGSTDLGDGGFAKTGWGLVFDSRTRTEWLPANSSIFIHSTYQFNKMDSEALSKAYSDALGNRVVVSDSKFNPILMTLGPSYDFHFGETITLSINTGAGVMFTNGKAFTIEVYNNSNNLIFDGLVNFDNSTSFAYMFGSEISFEILPETIRFNIFSEYVGSKQKVDWAFDGGERTGSFQKLQYWNSGFKLSIMKPE